MLHAGAYMIVVGGKEYLCLVLKPPVGIGMDDGGQVAEKISPDIFCPGINTFM